ELGDALYVYLPFRSKEHRFLTADVRDQSFKLNVGRRIGQSLVLFISLAGLLIVLSTLKQLFQLVQLLVTSAECRIDITAARSRAAKTEPSAGGNTRKIDYQSGVWH